MSDTTETPKPETAPETAAPAAEAPTTTEAAPEAAAAKTPAEATPEDLATAADAIESTLGQVAQTPPAAPETEDPPAPATTDAPPAATAAEQPAAETPEAAPAEPEKRPVVGEGTFTGALNGAGEKKAGPVVGEGKFTAPPEEQKAALQAVRPVAANKPTETGLGA